jgi:hypothetical protein
MLNEFDCTLNYHAFTPLSVFLVIAIASIDGLQILFINLTKSICKGLAQQKHP